jgi:iron complex outermembrane recepter protein
MTTSTMRVIRKLAGLTATSAITLATPHLAMAQDAAPAPAADTPATAGTTPDKEGIIVSGLRGRPRTVTSSPVPIDVFNTEAIQKAGGSSDMVSILTTLIPSYTAVRAANTTSDSFIRAPNLRGLPADDTLLLVNGHRRHKSASVQVSGYASQAADSSQIPAIALKSINVLRDGAAAQYGSDAIAGVIDYELKDADHGGSISVQGGQYYAGDGRSLHVDGNLGLKLTDHGFINISAEWAHDNATSRSRTFNSSAWNPYTAYATDPAFAAAVDAAGLNLADPLEHYGQPDEAQGRIFINSGLDLGSHGQLYDFANYGRSKGTAAGTYRVPGANQAVLDNPVRLADGSEYTFNEEFPLGMEPYFSGSVTDWSNTGGWKDKFDFGNGQTLTADISARYGFDKIAYSIVNTVNPSLGPDSPTSFNASSYVSDELAFNGDFVYTVPTSFTHGPLVLNFGAEFRREGFKIEPGDPASYEAGTYSKADPYSFCTTQSNYALRTLTANAPTDQGIDCTNAKDPVYTVLGVGSNGITGISPEDSGSWHTDSKSLYGELTSDVTSRWFLDLATRFESYQSFGQKLVWKAATRYNLTDWLGLRGSIGTGFRAPTAGQLHMTQTSIQTTAGQQLNVALYPATNAVAQYLGATPLKPETSRNYSLGITLTPMRKLTMTVDAYEIKIKDQLYTSSQITVTSAIQAAMEAAGVAGASSINLIQFYQNALDSTTKGIDVVASYRDRLFGFGNTGFTVAFNAHEYDVDHIDVSTVTFNAVSIYNFKHNLPVWRANATLNQDIGKLSVMLRANLYGPWSRQTTASSGLIQTYPVIPMFDAELSYPITRNFTIAVGATDIFNTYPPVNRIDDTDGRTYVDSVVPWQGGAWYGRVTFNF